MVGRGCESRRPDPSRNPELGTLRKSSLLIGRKQQSPVRAGDSPCGPTGMAAAAAEQSGSCAQPCCISFCSLHIGGCQRPTGKTGHPVGPAGKAREALAWIQEQSGSSGKLKTGEGARGRGVFTSWVLRGAPGTRYYNSGSGGWEGLPSETSARTGSERR